ncbi:DUF2225 domain-containing protein [Isachenkonia alkalipeptolytica]|uniref:DUF2225 domain-containing protein n=1 Tax=Isachenkonia alkalipeptolytica TaxID=2565777 RepID=A0AA44BEC6_9CLOT|nr:DUF2225 domain-containing protein [Isachenkonia alkalipeptolytica]NBG89174.1 DUF2225 domain-containing protein [Isachenkonia alkalipeptolytica]
MDMRLYDKDVDCPVCKNSFTTKKTRNRRLKVIKRHEDFFVEYEGISPIHYHVWVCPECGYSATESEFDNITKQEIPIIQQGISSKWIKRSYGGIRSLEDVESAYKLALATAALLQKSQGYIGGLCLKLAWTYREMGSDKETVFMENALKAYSKAYENEPLPIETIEEVPMIYLIGELNRKLGNYQQAINWFGKVVDHKEIKYHRNIKLKAREQWRLAKEAYNQKRKASQECP